MNIDSDYSNEVFYPLSHINSVDFMQSFNDALHETKGLFSPKSEVFKIELDTNQGQQRNSFYSAERRWLKNPFKQSNIVLLP